MGIVIVGKIILGETSEREHGMSEGDMALSIIAHLDRLIGTQDEEIYKVSSLATWNMQPGPQQYYRGDKGRPTCHACGKVHRGQGVFIYLRRRGSLLRFPTRALWACDACHHNTKLAHGRRGRTFGNRVVVQ